MLAQLPGRLSRAIVRRLQRYREIRRAEQHYRRIASGRVDQTLLEPIVSGNGVGAHLGGWLSENRIGAYIEREAADIQGNDVRRAAFLAQADALVRGNLVVYDRHLSFGTVIDWNRDITADRAWPNKFFLRYRHELLGRSSETGDYRFTWELNRQQHLLVLAIAYRISGNARYAERSIADIESWIEQNPPFFSINWFSAMEVGLRMVSWTLAIAIVGKTSLPEQRYRNIMAALYQQLYFLQGNLSVALNAKDGDTKLKNNHTIVELCSTLVICDAFPGLAGGMPADLMASLSKHLVTELQRQTWPDGMHVEQSSSYLRFVTEAVLLVRMCCDLPELDKFIQGYYTILKGLEYAPDRIFLFGDEDNGHVMVAGYPVLPDGIADIHAMMASAYTDADRNTGGMTVLNDSGHWVARKELGGQSVCVYFRAGPMDFPDIRGYAPHAHCDLLGFLLAVNGKLWLVDGGTYSYRERGIADEFRSSVTHNTLRVEGFEQMLLTGAFNSAGHAAGKLEHVDENTVRGSMTITRQGRQATVTRTMQLDESLPGIRFNDEVSAPADSVINWYLNLHPEVEVNNTTMLTRKGSDIRVEVLGWDAPGEQAARYSPRYGVLQEGKRIVKQGRTGNAGQFALDWAITFRA